MPRTMLPDREMGGGLGGPDDRRDHPMTTSNQSVQEESDFEDSSGPLFSEYSKAAEEADSKMVEHWQKDVNGILTFAGLFSAAVAALLTITVQDLRPNSQDTSAFYLGNIYQVLADPNVARSYAPSAVAKPPPFSPPRYAVWVNSLWFLSLVMSLSYSVMAVSLQQWGLRYLRLSQPPRCSPENRARMRAFFAGGVDRMHIRWVIEAMPTLLHSSLFLFFGGLAIFLFNVDREVFTYVTWWIGLFLMAYGSITVLPIIRHDSPYNSPLSNTAWFLYASLHYVTFKILTFIPSRGFGTWMRFAHSRGRYQRWMLGGMLKAAEETVSELSSALDLQILYWTTSALVGESSSPRDDSLENVFNAIIGFLNSKMVRVSLERDLPAGLAGMLDRFWGRTLLSNSANDSVKLRRLDISLKLMSLIRDSGVSSILHNILFRYWDKVPQTLEMGQSLAHLCTSDNREIAYYAQSIITRILAIVQERDDNWISLAARTFGLPERDFRDNIVLGGDNVLLPILIHVARQSFRSDYPDWIALEALAQLDIPNTLSRPQNDFCTLWNEIVQEARKQGPSTTPLFILKEIRHLYIALHQGIDAVPTAFSASTHDFNRILYEPSSYPFCTLASHRPDSTPHVSLSLPTQSDNSSDALSPSPTDGGQAASRQAAQAEQVNSVIESPSFSNPTTTSEIRTTSHGPDMTPTMNPDHSSSRPTGTSPSIVVTAAPQGITSPATLSDPLEGSEQQDSDTVAPTAEPGTRILSTASTHALTLTPIPTSLPNTPSESYDAGVASASDSSHFALSSIGSSIPASRPTDSATLPRLRARGLVNTRNICFANAVLQLLVISPPFWNLFKELGVLKEQRGAGVPETGEIPLVDAMAKFFKEFIVEEGSPSTQQQSQPATGGTSRADGEKKDDHVDSFEPTYVYDAMKEKRQLKPLLDGQQQDAEEFLYLYLNALDEELLALITSIGGRQSAIAALATEKREASQSNQTEVGGQGLVANFAESPITRIFGGKFRSPNRPDVDLTEDWRSLHLDIQHDSIRTVQDALAHISQPQSVQVSASGLGNASEQVLIEALPPVLVLHLNRVRYDAAAGGVTKIGKSIQLTPELEIPLDIMVPNSQRPSEPPHYKLYGVLYHHGESASRGHYTVDVLHPDGNSDTGEDWLHIDNEVVSPLRHEDVFGEHGTKRAAAYLLFYCRTSPIGTS